MKGQMNYNLPKLLILQLGLLHELQEVRTGICVLLVTVTDAAHRMRLGSCWCVSPHFAACLLQIGSALYLRGSPPGGQSPDLTASFSLVARDTVFFLECKTFWQGSLRVTPSPSARHELVVAYRQSPLFLQKLLVQNFSGNIKSVNSFLH